MRFSTVQSVSSNTVREMRALITQLVRADAPRSTGGSLLSDQGGDKPGNKSVSLLGLLFIRDKKINIIYSDYIKHNETVLA